MSNYLYGNNLDKLTIDLSVANSSKIGIIVSYFNKDITSNLLSGALRALETYTCPIDSIDTFWVPGAFEIPVLAKKLAKSLRYDALIALGCIIKGDTDHYEYICNSSTSGVMQVSIESEIPIAFGVLTTPNYDLAARRAGDFSPSTNKGYEAAICALSMISTIKSLG